MRCSQSVCLSRRSGTTATTTGSAAPASPPDISEGTGSDISGCDAQHLMLSRASNGTFEESEAYISSRCAPTQAPMHYPGNFFCCMFTCHVAILYSVAELQMGSVGLQRRHQ